MLPARADVPAAYASALGQRNAALRRVAGGVSSSEALGPWTEQVADLAGRLVEARRDLVELLAPTFTERAAELGLAGGAIAYDAEPPTYETLNARLARDLERGTTGLGPHLDDVEKWFTGRLTVQQLDALTDALRVVRDAVHPGAVAGADAASASVS